MTRAGHRLEAIKVLYQRASYADVVRQAQEIVELCLKALLRSAHIESPRVHDVSQALLDNKNRFPKNIQIHINKLAKFSHGLRRDRELAFYGSEDLTPSDFYSKEDGDEALEFARYVYEICSIVR